MPEGARSHRGAPHLLRQVGLWASIALIAAIGALSYFSIRALVGNAEEADRTQWLIREIELLVSDLKDAEKGQRALGERIELHTVPGTALWPAIADPARFEDALRVHFIGKPYRKADLARMLRKALADDTIDEESC